MGRIDTIAIYDGRNFWRGTQCNGNIADIQLEAGQTVVTCMPVDLAIQCNFLAFPDDAAGDVDLPTIFDETGLLDIQNLLFIANLECNGAVENAYDMRVLRTQKLQTAAHGGEKLTRNRIEIDNAMFVVRQGLPESRTFRFWHFKGNAIHLELSNTYLAGQKRQRRQPQAHRFDSADFDALLRISDRYVTGFERNVTILIQR